MLRIIVEGLLEIYLVAVPDEQKGSNMECSALSFALDRAYEELKSRVFAEMESCDQTNNKVSNEL